MRENSDANRKKNSALNGRAVCPEQKKFYCDQKLSSMDKKNFPWEKEKFYSQIKKFIS
jgi:hypothetical protein